MASAACLFGQAPQWVTRRPVSETKYIGIGMAQVSDPDYRNIAITNAMLDIASQISVNINSTSFMQTLDVDGHSKDLFEEKVQSKVAANITGQELKDTYQSGNLYYIMYELDKKKYEKFIDSQKKKGTELGLDYYQKGRDAEAAHNYVNAVKLYAKGLEAIEPYLYLNLEAKYEGKKIDLPTELYNACLSVFSGFELVPNVTEVNVQPFKPCPDPLAVCLSKGGNVIPNVSMKATFTTGDGELTAANKTDVSGTAVFYITNVTSKLAIQTVDVKIDDSFIGDLPESYKALMGTHAWPGVTFTLVLANPSYTAYYVVEKNDLDACEKQIRSLLANNNFDLSVDNAADLYITLSTVCQAGAKVQGELYEMKEYFASLNLKIYNNKDKIELMNYNVPQLRILVPAHNSEEQAKAMCTRELMKRVDAQLSQAIKKLNINN
jgi:hypothetical protein